MAMHLSTRRWQDQLTLLLGLWLFVSPWVFGYPADAPQAINAYVAGLDLERDLVQGQPVAERLAQLVDAQ